MTQRVVAVRGRGLAADTAELLRVLPALPAAPPGPVDAQALSALERWIEWGAFALTGRPGQAPVAPRAPVADRIAAAADLLTHVTALWGDGVVLDPGAVLSSRAREAGFIRRGDVSANGSCRLFRCVDGWAAVNLARSADLDTVAALLDVSPRDVGGALPVALAEPGTVETLRSLEVPTAVLAESSDLAPIAVRRLGAPDTVRRPLVLDLSAMWAGPLCASILRRAGARVIKVESPDRPDGARSGPPRFFEDLHRGKELCTVPFGHAGARPELDGLLQRADLVIESSRPRALRQLGIDAEAWVGERAGRTWISITGYGRNGAGADRVAFGDDAAVAGGLVAHDDQGPVFCADAIADPLTGLYAGLAAAGCVAAGGGYLVDVAMAGVCAHVNRACRGAAPVTPC